MATIATPEREARLKELFAAGWTTEPFAEFWAAPDLKYIPSIITDDVVGYWPGGRTVRGKAEYMQALEDLLALLPDLRLEVPEHTMSADGEFGFSHWVMHATIPRDPRRAGWRGQREHADRRGDPRQRGRDDHGAEHVGGGPRTVGRRRLEGLLGRQSVLPPPGLRTHSPSA
jgi:ketosteroid isomerase-like protein